MYESKKYKKDDYIMSLYQEMKQATANGSTLVVNKQELQEAIRLKNSKIINFMGYLECEDNSNHYELIDLTLLK